MNWGLSPIHRRKGEEVRKRTFLSAVAALAVAVSLGACGGTPAAESGQQPDSQQPAAEQAATRVVTDSLGREVEIPAEVERIAASGPVAQQVLLTVAPEKMVGLSGELTDEQLVAAGVKPNLIRFSVGIENIDDILEDIENSLKKL